MRAEAQWAGIEIGQNISGPGDAMPDCGPEACSRNNRDRPS
jgi:hypothetical protein